MKLIDIETKQEYVLYTVMPSEMKTEWSGNSFVINEITGWRIESLHRIPLQRVYNLVTPYEDIFVLLVTQQNEPHKNFPWFGYICVEVNNLEVLRYVNEIN